MYPTQGQSPEQEVVNQQQCQMWASQQTCYQPQSPKLILPGRTTAEEQFLQQKTQDAKNNAQ